MPTTPVTGIPRAVGMRPSSRNATQPSLPRNPPRSTGTQGTPGGLRAGRPGRQRAAGIAGVEMYLWILVVVEVAAMGGLRKLFKRYHGG